MEPLVPYIMIGSLVLVYVLTYTLNKRTPVPDECKDVMKEAACNSCKNFACSHRVGTE